MDDTLIKSVAAATKKLQTGIKKGDWQTVCDAYENLSGKKIDPPGPQKTDLEKMRELLGDDDEEESLSRVAKNKDKDIPDKFQFVTVLPEGTSEEDITKRAEQNKKTAKTIKKERRPQTKASKTVEKLKTDKNSDIVLNLDNYRKPSNE